MFKLKRHLTRSERRKRATQRYSAISNYSRLPTWVIVAGFFAAVAYAVVMIGRMIIPH